ncbi:Dabb family protein [bacterium]|nr:Dabb family protein [bacterium]
MTRFYRFFITLSIPTILLAFALLLLFEPSQAKPTKSDKIGFIHNVYFWVNEGTPPSAIDQLIGDCKTYLGSVKTVEKIQVGIPAGTPREVVDNSFAVNLIVYFKDKAAHDYYQKAKKHKDFIARNQDHWKKVQVYDMLPK